MNRDNPEVSQTDAEFLRAVDSHREDEGLVLAVRRVVAEWCGVATTDIRADAPTTRLHERMKSGWARGWDETGFLMKLEEELHATIDMSVQLPPFLGGRFIFWTSHCPTNLAEWIRGTVMALRGKIKPSGDPV